MLTCPTSRWIAQVYLDDGQIQLHLVTARKMKLDGEEVLVVHVEPVPKSR